MQYEIHITVLTSNIEQFINDCKLIDVKPIVIETQNNIHFEQQVMTSSKHEGDDYKETVNSIVKALSPNYTILRKKVEIKPEDIIHPLHIYYESHLRLKLDKTFNAYILKILCEQHRAHLSKNIFKKDENYNFQMITYRDTGISFGNFCYNLYQLRQALEDINVFYDKIEIEECIMDSNEDVDKNWLKK